MCEFIILVAPSADVHRIAEVMDRHRRAAIPLDNPSVRKVLRTGEYQYLTTRGPCDCGTVLASDYPAPETVEERIAREVPRWKRKGWSDAKIARAIEDQRRSEARPRARRPGNDSFESWSAVLSALETELRLPHAGLLVRSWSDVETDIFDAARRDLTGAIDRVEGLGSMRNDELTVFPFRRSRQNA